MCVGSEFQVDGAETENAREVKLLVMPVDEEIRGQATGCGPVFRVSLSALTLMVG